MGPIFLQFFLLIFLYFRQKYLENFSKKIETINLIRSAILLDVSLSIPQCRKTVMTPLRIIQGTRDIKGYLFYENLRPNQQLDVQAMYGLDENDNTASCKMS